MIEIVEHGLTNGTFKIGSGHEEFLNAIRKLTLDNEITSHEKIFLSVLYDPNAARSSFNVYGYDANQVSYKDDLAISVLRAELGALVRDDYASGIDGVPVKLVLAFGKDPFASGCRSMKRGVSNGEDPVLNVVPVEPRYRLEQMILADHVREELEDIIILVNLEDKIYDLWGFGEVDPKPRAVINFHGPSGTGKTMAAHALAHRFGKKILSLNYADIESKFVGDAPKNLMAAFEIANEHSALLFFDEADSFLGKRITNVSHSADQAVNSLRSQLLMLLEDYTGVVVFATNLMENYDSAFNSRILKHIKFTLPTLELRIELIKNMIPSKMPHTQQDFIDDNIRILRVLI